MSNSGQGLDFYHNPFYNSADMFAEQLRQNASSIPVGKRDVDVGRVVEPEGPSIEKMQLASIQAAQMGQQASLGGSGVNETFIIAMDSLKDSMIECFREFSTNNRMSTRIESLIGQLEAMEDMLGLGGEKFDRLQNMSGLGVDDTTSDNAKKVVENTVKGYRLYSITSIRCGTARGGPAIEVGIIGVEGKVGFEVTGTVIPLEEFDGNEAIDYVYSDKGGLMSVKARVGGSWQDVSDRFEVNYKVKRYSLKEVAGDLHSVFVGEKIVAEGKEKIVAVLKNKKHDVANVKFGTCRIFSNDEGIIDTVRDLIRVNGA